MTHGGKWLPYPAANHAVSDLDQYLLTIREAMQTYGLKERTIRRWLTDGRLTRYRRQGDRLIRVDRREIERLRQWRAEDD